MKNLFTILMLSLFLTPGWAQWDGTVDSNFAGGDGAVATPFEIATAPQLAYLNQYVANNGGAIGEYFKLTADIDLSGNDWSPVGQQAVPFKGTFDGNGHIISGMTIVVSAGNQAGTGLFGWGENASIINTGVKDYNITGETIGSATRIGGLIGYGNPVTIDKCFTSGIINLNGGDNAKLIGGFIGRSEAGTSISNCYTRSDVSVISATGGERLQEISGFAGTQEGGEYVNCYAYGTLTVESTNKGATNGFAGYASGSRINCYLNETTNPYIAGGVEQKSETFFKSTDMVIILGSGNWHFDNDMPALNEGFPVLAWQGGSSVVPATVTTQINGNGIVDGGGEFVVGADITLVAIADYGYTFTGWSGNSTSTANVIVVENIQEDLTFQATFEVSSTTPTDAWDGSTITSQSDLMAFSAAVSAGDNFDGKTVSLANDISLDKSMSWEPIGLFAGTFDGNGYVIKDLTIYKNAMYKGLFSEVSGTVKNLGIEDAMVYSGGRSAIIAGYLNGANALIDNCYVSGQVISKWGGTDVGCVAGRIENGATVQNSYSTASITGTGGGTGGVVGTAEGGTLVSSCYATGKISSPDSAPGVVGYLAGTVENCYFDSETTGISNAGSATSATTDEMKNLTMVDNLNGTSSPAIWKEDTSPTINNGYPILVWQESTNTGIINGLNEESFNVFVINSRVNISNASVGDNISVISMAGVVYKTIEIRNTQITFNLPQGVWIISNGKEVRKIFVR